MAHPPSLDTIPAHVPHCNRGNESHEGLECPKRERNFSLRYVGLKPFARAEDELENEARAFNCEARRHSKGESFAVEILEP